MDQPVRIHSGTGPGESTLHIDLSGEIDFTNSTTVGGAVRDSVAQAQPRTVRVDLSGVTFLDSSGIGVLVIAHKATVAAGATYQVTGPNPEVYEQLRLTGLVDLFGIDPPRVAVP